MAQGKDPPGNVRELGLLPCPGLFSSLTPHSSTAGGGQQQAAKHHRSSVSAPTRRHRGARPMEGNPLQCQRRLHPDSRTARVQSSTLPRPRGQLREHSLPRGCSSSKASPSKLPGLKLARGYRLLLGTACGTCTRTHFCTGTLSSPEQWGTARPLPKSWGWQQSPRLPTASPPALGEG